MVNTVWLREMLGPWQTLESNKSMEEEIAKLDPNPSQLTYICVHKSPTNIRKGSKLSSFYPSMITSKPKSLKRKRISKGNK